MRGEGRGREGAILQAALTEERGGRRVRVREKGEKEKGRKEESHRTAERPKDSGHSCQAGRQAPKPLATTNTTSKQDHRPVRPSAWIRRTLRHYPSTTAKLAPTELNTIVLDLAHNFHKALEDYTRSKIIRKQKTLLGPSLITRNLVTVFPLIRQQQKYLSTVRTSLMELSASRLPGDC